MTHTPIDIAALEADLQRQLDRTRRLPTEPLISISADDYRALIKAVKERETMNPCNKIFDHKWLSPECVETGCQSLLLVQRAERAEKAESALAEAVKERDVEIKQRIYMQLKIAELRDTNASLRAPLAEAGEALEDIRLKLSFAGQDIPSPAVAASNKNQAYHKAVSALAAIQSALREIPTSDAKPLDFP